jgi:hypothetical protein
MVSHSNTKVIVEFYVQYFPCALKSKAVFATMPPCTAEAQLKGGDRYANPSSQLNSTMRVDGSIPSSLT